MGCFGSSNTSNATSKFVKSNSIPNPNINSKSSIENSNIKSLKTKESLIKIRSNQLVKEGEKTVQDNYKVLEKIGSGGFGEVYKVVHIKTSIIRAMKIIKKEKAMDCTDLEKSVIPNPKFINEIKILIEIDHPNIIKIFEYFFDEKNFYIIMEYIPGGELYGTIIQKKKFFEKDAAMVMYQVLSAVNYLNTKKIVHRDIKPENILIMKDLKIKLIDFGTSSYFENSKKMKARVGTSYYIAPEVINKNYDDKCDIWSCGIILHVLLVGYPPFMGKTNKEILGKVLLGQSAKLFSNGADHVSPLAKDLISKMLNYDPEKRISAQEALTHPWFIGSHVTSENYDEEFAKNVVENIKNFTAREKLQQATIAYIVHFIFAAEDVTQLYKIFKSFDKNSDGRLSLNEFKSGYTKHYGKLLCDIKLQEIFENLDQDFDGFIEYEEFLRAALNQNTVLEEINLKLAFDQFDLNNDGALSVEEIKDLLETSDNEYIDKLVIRIDTNKDGVVSFSEFCVLMKSIILEKTENIDKEKFCHL